MNMPATVLSHEKSMDKLIDILMRFFIDSLTLRVVAVDPCSVHPCLAVPCFVAPC